MRIIALPMIVGVVALALAPAAQARTCRPAPDELTRTVRQMQPHVARYLGQPVPTPRVCLDRQRPGVTAVTANGGKAIYFDAAKRSLYARPHARWPAVEHMTALHELVHVATWSDGLGAPVAQNEGIVDAVAWDIGRTSWFPALGARIPAKFMPYAYATWAIAAKTASVRACAESTAQADGPCATSWRREMARLGLRPRLNVNALDPNCVEGGDCLERAPRTLGWQDKAAFIATRYAGETCDLQSGARMTTGILAQAGAPGARELPRDPVGLLARADRGAPPSDVRAGDVVIFDQVSARNQFDSCTGGERQIGIMLDARRVLMPSSPTGLTSIAPLATVLRGGTWHGRIRL